ncbi:hypothetical protein HMPREF9370_0893 [Neisseria wadsworthii 9715]|uniref:Uncharacterized protein n=1 Tax=Neisseria wadsworthii 9715 TaxID=1030841 RepID=G4CP84_9NEIS|nr:hypothetical protein HMPREF9370_0893 [Neisseria wadsworthii 9715]
MFSDRHSYACLKTFAGKRLLPNLAANYYLTLRFNLSLNTI